MKPRIEIALFDFGDTLAREPFCVLPPPGVPDWEQRVLATYEEDRVAHRWCAGEMGYFEVVERVAAHCGLEVETTRSAMEHDWRHLRWNQTAFDFARELGRAGRAAIVTVNPDIFSDLIVPFYGLDRDFPVIVTSWQERTNDKVALCEVALERIGAAGELATTLLVDNRQQNVADFRARGGQAYYFIDDGRFASDLPALKARLA